MTDITEPEPERSTPEHPVEEKKEPALPERRSFLAALIGVGAACLGILMGIPLVRFALYPLFAKTAETGWSEVGPVDSFASLSAPVEKSITVSQRDGWRELVSTKSVYVIKDSQGQLKVFSTVCPHLGCGVPWNSSRQQFLCPCHGSVFAPDGARVSGPTPRGLDSLESSVQDGRLMVRYQYFRQLVPEKEVIG